MFRKLQSLIVICVFSFLGIINVYAQSLTLISPTPSSTLQGCEAFEVKWSSTGSISYVNIDFSTDGINYTNIASFINNTGSYFLAVPAPVSNPNYKLKIYDPYNSSTVLATVGGFAIGAGSYPKLAFTNPQSYGNPLSYKSGEYVYFTWNSNDTKCLSKIEIVLSTNGGINFPITISGKVNNNQGYYYWAVPSGINSTNCVAKIFDSGNSANSALSEGFSIVQLPPSFVVDQAINNTNVSACSSLSFRYKSTSDVSYTLDYSANGGTSWNSFNTYLSANTGGSFYSSNISIPSIPGAYLVRWYPYDKPANSVVGLNINVTSASPDIVINSPLSNSINNAGEYLYYQWNSSTSCIPLVSFDFSSDGGVSWNAYQSNQTNYGYASIPIPISFSGDYLFRVRDASNANVSSISQFFVSNKSLIVSSIAGVVPTCSNPTITWNTSGVADNYFAIDYSTNGGTTWNSIVSNNYNYYFNNPKTYNNWSVPATVSGLVSIRVRGNSTSVTGMTTITVGGSGNATYLQTPSGGSYSPCNLYIKWDGTACSYDIYLTTNSGASLIPVQTNVTNKYYFWNAPSSILGLSPKMVVTAVNNVNASIMGSAFTFSKTFSSISPNSGSIIAGNQTYVNWGPTLGCLIPNFKLELTTNSGASFITITSSGINSDYYYYNFPTISATNRLKISDVTDPSISFLGSNFIVTTAGVISNPTLSITSALNSFGACSSNNVSLSRSESTYLYFKIEFSSDGGTSWDILNSQYYSGTFTPSFSIAFPNVQTTNARLRFSYRDNIGVSVVSSPFTISGGNVSITGISTSASYVAGITNQYIGYTAASCIKNLNIELSTNGGVNFAPYANGIRNQTYFYLSVPNMPTSNAKLRISSTDNPSINFVSNSFSILATPTITVTSLPTSVIGCTSSTVLFKYIDNAGYYFNVDYSTDGGANWNPYLVSVYASGYPTYSLSFAMPPSLVNSTYKLRIYDKDNFNSVVVSSDINVSPSAPASISISNPNASSIYVSGSQQTINWVSTGAGCNLNTIQIEYSLDGGTTYKLLKSDFPVASNSINFTWYIPNGYNSSNAIVKLSNSIAPVVSTTSQSFVISDPYFIVSVPGNAVSGTGKTISYRYGGLTSGDNYYSFYSSDGGASWIYSNYVGYFSNSGNSTTNFAVPSVNSITGFLFSIANNSVYASATKKYISNPFFVDRPLLTVTSPVAGQAVQTGPSATTSVAFTYANWTGNTMYAFYSYDNGLSATYTGTPVFLSGSFSSNFTWTLPTVTSITSASIVWGNNSSWASSTNRYIGESFNLIPPTNNQITVTGLSDTNPCQGKIVAVSFTGFGTFTGSNIFRAEINYASTPGSGIQIGQLVSTLSSGIVLVTVPSFSGGYNLRVYSSSPYISLATRLIARPITISANSCITANNNNALLSIDGIGTLPLPGSVAYQINTTFSAGNQFIAQLSNSSGSFVNPLVIGSVTATGAGTIPVTIPIDLPTSSNYQIRIVSTNPVVVGSPSISFTINNAYIDVWSVAGNNFCPGKKFNTIFDADANFLTGNQFRIELSNTSGNFPTNNFIGLLNDNSGGIDLVANSTIPSSISTSANYRVRVQSTNPFSNTSYNAESPYFTVYNTCINPLSFSAGPYFSGAPLRVNVSTNSSFDAGNIYIAQLSDAFGSFSNPQFIGSVSGVGLATISGIVPSIASSGSNYYVRVISTNHPFTSAGTFLGTVSPLQITLSPSINASGFCQDAYVKLGNMTVTGAPATNNVYTIEMNGYSSSDFNLAYKLYSFASSVTGIVSVPGFYIPTSVPGNGFNRSFRVLSSNPPAISQNILGGFSYNTKCFGSVALNTGIYMPNQNYSTTYNLYPGVAYAAGNQMIAEISSNGFVTAVGIGFVTSVSSGTIPTAIPANLPTGMYQVRVRATDFASTSFPENIYVSQVNIAPGFVDNIKQYCQGGPLAINNFTVSSPVNPGNTYIIQVSTSQSFPNGSTFDLTSIASSATGSVPTGNIIIPVNSLMGTNYYYYRIVSTNPYAAVNGNNQIYISNTCVFSTNANSGSYCPASTGSVQYGNVSLNPGNRITALLSDALGNFNTPLQIGSVLDNTAGGSKFLNFTIPSGLQQGASYKVKLITSDFVSEGNATSPFEIKQVCIGQPGGFNTALQQCSFIPLVTVSAFGSVNPDNTYRLILTNSSGTPVSGGSLNSLLGTVMSGNTGVISFANVVIPTVTGTYRLRVDATSPNVSGILTNNFSIINNCLGAPYFPASKICAGSPYLANVYIGSGNTYNVGNQFIVELSNGSGSFASPIVVASQTTTLNNFNIVVTIPSGLSTGSNYQLRTRSTNPVFTSNAGNTFAIDQICLSAGAIDFGPYIGASSTINIPVVNVGSVTGGNTYSASLYNQYGTFIGSIGSSSTQTISGILPAVSSGGYYYALITSNSPVATSYNSNYFIVNPTDIKLAAVNGSYCVGSTVNSINFTVAGTVGGGNQYFLDLSDANGYFYYGYNNLASFSDASVGSKVISAVLPIGIASSPNYKFRVRSSNGSISNEVSVNINATFEWSGANGKNWNDPQNWSCPLIPTANIDVLIPVVGNNNYPEINVTNAVARNMTVNTLASAFVLDNGLLSIYGNLVVNGTFDATTLGGVVFQGGYASTHDILGTGTVNLGQVTVPGFNYLNIRNTVSRMYRYYNYGYTNNYSVVNNIYEFYNYSNFYAYNNFTVLNRFHNEYVFNVYNTYVSSPSFYVGNYFVNNSQYFNSSVSNFYFTGANAQILGTYSPTFYNFYVNNNVNLNLGVAINIGSGFANSGYFNGVGYPVSFINSGYNVPIVISGSGYSNFGSVVFNNTYGVNITNNIAVQNDFINIAGFIPGSSVVSFTGNGIQNISSTGVNNLTFNGINVADVNSDLNVQANLSVKGSFSNRGRFRNNRATYFESNFPQLIDGFGITRFNTFYNYNTHASGLTILTNIVVDGNLENNGYLNAVGYTISTTGLTAQTISGTTVATLGSLENSNTAGVDVNQDVVIQGSFSNRGRLRSKSNTVTFGGDFVQQVSSTSETVFNTIVVTNSVANVNLDGGFVVTGDITSNGNLDASTSTISTSGTSLQTISGVNDVTFGEIVNTNTTGVVATQDVVVTGSFSNRGRFRSTQTLNLTGTADQAITGTVPLDLTHLNNDNTTVVTLETPILVSGNISNQGVLDGSTSVISTTGTDLQTISGDNISLGTIVNINVSGGVLITDPIEIKGNLVNNGDLESSSIVSFTGVNQSITGTTAVLVNDVAITDNASVAVAGSFRTRGRFVNNSTNVGLVAAPSSTVTFEGDTKQSIEGSTTTNFGQVSVTNASGVDVMQNISSTSISLSGGNLTVDTLKTVAITSADPNAIVRTNDSYVDGTLSRVVTATGAAYSFPVGTTDAYRGVDVTFSGSNTAGKIAVTPSSTAPKVTLPAANGAPLAVFDATLGDTLKGILPLSWKVEAQNSTAPGIYDINLQAPVTLAGYTDPNALRVVKRTDESSPWVLAGTAAPVTTTAGKVLRVGRRNVSSFSEFAIAGTCSNVSRVSSKPSIDKIGNAFKSNLEGNNYEWSINDTVVRALTARQITPVKNGRYRVRVILSGCSSDASDFIEFTGTGTGFTEINSNSDFKLYPNPTKGEFILESNATLNGDYLIEMFDMIGKAVFAKTMNQVEGKAFRLTYNTSGLPTGIYFIKVSSHGHGKVLKLIVE